MNDEILEMSLQELRSEIAQWIGVDESSLGWMDKNSAVAYLLYLQNRMVVIENQKDLDLSRYILDCLKKYGVILHEGKYYIVIEPPVLLSEEYVEKFPVVKVKVNTLVSDEFNAKTIYWKAKKEIGSPIHPEIYKIVDTEEVKETK